MSVSFYSTNKLRKLGYIRTLYRVTRSQMLFIRSHVRVAMQIMWDRHRQLKSRITEHKNHIRWNTSTRNVITEHRLQEDHDFD